MILALTSCGHTLKSLFDVGLPLSFCQARAANSSSLFVQAYARRAGGLVALSPESSQRRLRLRDLIQRLSMAIDMLVPFRLRISLSVDMKTGRRSSETKYIMYGPVQRADSFRPSERAGDRIPEIGHHAVQHTITLVTILLSIPNRDTHGTAFREQFVLLTFHARQPLLLCFVVSRGSSWRGNPER
jgi:hypothetical protein